MTVHYTHATPADANVIATLIQQLWSDDSVSLERITRVISTDDHQPLLAWDENTLAGFVDGFTTIDQRNYIRWEIDLLGVAESHRGLGIARTLVAKMVEIAISKQVNQIRAVVRANNIGAEATFRTQGFTQSVTQQMLVMSGSQQSTTAQPTDGAIPVDTLLYDGYWLDYPLTISEISKWVSALLPNQTAGILIPESDPVTIELMRQNGFATVANFHYWTLQL